MVGGVRGYANRYSRKWRATDLSHRRLDAESTSLLSKLYLLAARPIKSIPDLTRHLTEILDMAIQLNGGNRGSIHLADSESSSFRMIVQRSLPASFASQLASLPASSAFLSAAIENRKRIYHDINSIPGFPPTTTTYLRSARIRGVHFIPLISSEEEVAGVLTLYHHQSISHEPLRPDPVDLLSVLTADMIVRMKIQEKLRASKERYRLLTESMEEGLKVCKLIRNQDGKAIDYEVLEVNPAYERYTGRSRCMVIGQKMSDGICPNGEYLLPKYDEVIRSRIPLKIEINCGGSLYSIFIFPLNEKDECGSVFHDITDQRIFEADLAQQRDTVERLFEDQTAELQRAERHYRTLVENIPVCISRFDKQLRYMYRSQKYDGEFHFSGRTVINKTWGELSIPEEAYLNWIEIYNEVIRTGIPREFESQYPNRLGEMRDILNRVVPELDAEGRVESLLNISLDITERKHLDAELHRLDRLNTIGEMAAAIGHEVRNPLTTVRGYLQILQQKSAFDNHRAQFEIMIEEIDRANSIISDFLSLAKNRTIDLQLHNLDSIVERLLPLLQAEALLSSQQIIIVLGGVPAFRMDEKEIRQLLLNLTRNAFEAMPVGGVLTISTIAEPQRIILSVQDTGTGIQSGILERLGTPFITTKEKGTGLGLPICYRIAERHKARIEAITSPHGTTFNVHFRLTPPQIPKIAPEP